MFVIYSIFFFFFNDPATTDIYTLSLHDALPISVAGQRRQGDEQGSRRVVHDDGVFGAGQLDEEVTAERVADRKSTRLNSSHANISYAVFCLKKKKRQQL